MGAAAETGRVRRGRCGKPHPGTSAAVTPDRGPLGPLTRGETDRASARPVERRVERRVDLGVPACEDRWIRSPTAAEPTGATPTPNDTRVGAAGAHRRLGGAAARGRTWDRPGVARRRGYS